MPARRRFLAAAAGVMMMPMIGRAARAGSGKDSGRAAGRAARPPAPPSKAAGAKAAGTKAAGARTAAGSRQAAKPRPRPADTFIAPLANAPFPYDGPVADGTRPFFDIYDRSSGRRLHSVGDGTVYPEVPHYRDSRVLFHLPAGFDPRRPFPIVVFFHGHMSELERTVLGELGVARQIDGARRNLALLAPQLARDAADSSPGKLFRQGGLKRLLDEACATLARRTGGKADLAAFRRAPVVLAAYSGGYRAVAYCLDRGGLGRRIAGVFLLDALYGDLDKFAAWMTARRRTGFLVSLHGESTLAWHEELRARLAAKRLKPADVLPAQIRPGTMAFLRVATEHAALPVQGPPAAPLAEMLRRLTKAL